MNKKISLSAKTTVLLSVVMVFLISCSNNDPAPQQNDTMNNNDGKIQLNESSGNSMDTVPLAIALINIKHYQDTCDSLFQGRIPLRAYTVHANDMLLSMGIDPTSVKCEYDHARVYLGLDSANNFKLYFTPVMGADLKPGVMNPGTDVILKDEHGNGYVMDLNAPCPNTCDITSPLYDPQ